MNASRHPVDEDGREKIAIVDPQPLVRSWISSLLSTSGNWKTAWECADSVDALKNVEGEEPDLLITELRLRDGLDGLMLIKALLRNQPDLRVLVYSSHSEEFYAERCLRAGAMGYLHKHDPSYRLEEAVESILHGELVVNKRIGHQAMRNASGKVAMGEIGERLRRLTDRELEIILLLGRGTPFREAARVLGITNSTVQVHASGIRRKLGLEGTLELMAFAVTVHPLIDEGIAPEKRSSITDRFGGLSHPDLISTVQRFVERYP
jgi:DNA-binding NarL/FixJ family response regulator